NSYEEQRKPYKSQNSSTKNDLKQIVNPKEFDGYRFLSVNPGYTGGDARVSPSGGLLDGVKSGEEEEGKEMKKTMFTTSRDFLTFGHGRNACPGRFFAALGLKAVLATLVLDYDVKSVAKESGSGYEPKDIWFGENLLPDMKARGLGPARFQLGAPRNPTYSWNPLVPSGWLQLLRRGYWSSEIGLEARWMDRIFGREPLALAFLSGFGTINGTSILSKIRLSIEGFGPYQDAYNNYPMLQIPELDGWKIIVQKQFFDEVLRAPEEILNFHEATFE
ncbi:5148_t:CDS:2, partial [Acaulospora colombiana]